MRPEMAHCNLDGDYSCERPHLKYADGGRLFKLSFARSPAAEWNSEQFADLSGEGRRGKCRGFSFGSRRRLLERLNTVSVAADKPVMVTLTLPDDMFDDCVSGFAESAKGWLDTLLKRLHRSCRSACGFWRIEWKARESGRWVGKLFPHFHLLIWGLPVRTSLFTGQDESFVLVEDKQLEFVSLYRESHGIGRVAGLDEATAAMNCLPAIEGKVKWCDGDGFYGVTSGRICNRFRLLSLRGLMFEKRGERPWMSFRDWCALSWYHVVGSHNLKHFGAGVTVEPVRSFAGVAYCAKAYLSKVGAESFLSDVQFGRSWGIFNRASMPWAKIVELDLPDDVGVRLRRVARRYLEHRLGRRVRRPYGVTLYCDTARWVSLLPPAPT